MKSLWLTGADGFAGTWLRRRLEKAGGRVLSLILPDHLQSFGGESVGLDLLQAGLSKPGEDVLELATLPKPSGLIHLAAMTFPPACEAEPEVARAINVDGPARLYEQLLSRWPELPILHVSSGHVYRPQQAPLSEDQILEPVNVYGETKLDGEAMALGYRNRGHRVSVVRPFNHSGPGQASTFVLPSFANRLALLEREGGGKLEVGRLDSIRDFLHVGDVADAYFRLLDCTGDFDVTNLCSGRGVAMQEFLDGMLSRCSGTVEVATTDERLRGNHDADCLVGDVGRLESLLGEAPTLAMDRLLDELMQDARKRVEAGEDFSLA